MKFATGRTAAIAAGCDPRETIILFLPRMVTKIEGEDQRQEVEGHIALCYYARLGDNIPPSGTTAPPPYCVGKADPRSAALECKKRATLRGATSASAQIVVGTTPSPTDWNAGSLDPGELLIIRDDAVDS